MEEQFGVRLEKLKKLSDLGIAAYPYRFERTMRFAACHRQVQGS